MVGTKGPRPGGTPARTARESRSPEGPWPGRFRARCRGKKAETAKPRGRRIDVEDKVQKRLSSLLVLATFVALQIPIKKRFVAEQIPGRRGPREDVAEALVQGAARMAAVVLASTFVRGLAARRGSGQDRAVRKGHRRGGTRLKVSLEPGG